MVSLLAVPILLILEVVLLGSVPYGRPLSCLFVVQGLVTAGGLVLAVRHRAVLRAAADGLFMGLADGWRQASRDQRLILMVGVLSQAAATGYGAWNTPWSVDEFNYHIPQAVQPYQDGRLGPVQASVVWADSYPRGGALLYYWTLQLAHTDAGFIPSTARSDSCSYWPPGWRGAGWGLGRAGR
ncbi:MAG: hypothetical protein HRF43_00160 [Phycisphaerae bacterium]